MNSLRKSLPFVGLLLVFVGLSLVVVFYSKGMLLRDRRLLVAYAVIGLGALFLLWGLYGRAFGPNLKYYVSYALTSLFVLGSLVMVFLVVRNHSLEWDVTEQKLHSLHPRTIEYLRDLNKDIRITAFPSPEHKSGIEQVLDRYSRYSPRITVEITNPFKEIQRAKQFGENIMLGDIYVWTGKRAVGDEPASPDFREKKLAAYRVQDLTESALTNAVVEVMREGRVKAYFLTGHGETGREPAAGPGMFGGPRGGGGGPSYSNVEELLKSELAFGAADLQLRDYGFVPDDCSLLVCAGPKADLFPLEAEAIARYLAGGGRALFLLDPSRRKLVRLRQFEILLGRFGVKIEADGVLENNPLTQLTGDPTLLLVDRFGSHQIVNNPVQAVQMAFARTVARSEDVPSTLTVSELLYSSRMSWSETVDTLLSGREIQLPTADRMKERPLAVAVSETGADKGMRLVVFGDSDVFENTFYSNADWLCANAVNWLVAREDLIDIPTKRLTNTAIFPSQVTLRALSILFILVFPGAIFLGGVGYVLIRRRVR